MRDNVERDVCHYPLLSTGVPTYEYCRINHYQDESSNITTDNK